VVLLSATAGHPDLRMLDFSSSGITARLGAGLMLLPSTLLLLHLVRLGWISRWKSLIQWLGLVLTLSSLSATVILYVNPMAKEISMEVGEHYSWQGWYGIVPIGVYQTGVVLILVTVIRVVWSGVRRCWTSWNRVQQLPTNG
jgi:hypothetical protein